MLKEFPENTTTPLAPLGLDLALASDPVDLLDGVSQIRDILANAARLAACLAAASDTETVAEKDLTQGLKVLAGYLESARLAVWQWQNPVRASPKKATEA